MGRVRLGVTPMSSSVGLAPHSVRSAPAQIVVFLHLPLSECNMTSSETDARRLTAALERRSDIELRLSCGKSIRAHSLKLSLASSVLGDLIDSVMDEQITAMRAAKKKRDDEGTSDAPLTLPHITVFAS